MSSPSATAAAGQLGVRGLVPDAPGYSRRCPATVPDLPDGARTGCSGSAIPMRSTSSWCRRPRRQAWSCAPVFTSATREPAPPSRNSMSFTKDSFTCSWSAGICGTSRTCIRHSAPTARSVRPRAARPGHYQLMADFVPTGGAPQMIQRIITTAGYEGPLAPALTADLADKVVDNTRIQLAMREAVAGGERLMTFTLTDATTGAPASNIEPYLGAPGHLVSVSADLSAAAHSHPGGAARPGIERRRFNCSFPARGHASRVGAVPAIGPCPHRIVHDSGAERTGQARSRGQRPQSAGGRSNLDASTARQADRRAKAIGWHVPRQESSNQDSGSTERSGPVGQRFDHGPGFARAGLEREHVHRLVDDGRAAGQRPVA